MASALAILGSASDVGKSLVAAGICRLLADAGLKVAPFKAQNMANQAGVTPLARLCALIPPPRFGLLRYHGVLAGGSA